jgi:hypothetical protein
VRSGKLVIMGIILAVLLLGLIFVGVGVAVHLLWIVAVILLLLWAIGWMVGAAESGSRRRWYGRY